MTSLGALQTSQTISFKLKFAKTSRDEKSKNEREQKRGIREK